MLLACRAHHKFVPLAELALLDPHQGDDAQIIIEPGVDDQCLQWRLSISVRGRHLLNEILQHILDTHAGLGAGGYCLCGINTDNFLDFLLHPLGVGLRQIHLVQYRQYLEALLDCRVAIGDRLRFNPLTRIHYQQRTLASGERTGDFIGKVDVAGGINKVQLVRLAILRLIVERHALRFDGNAALPLKIHRIEHLIRHFSLRQTAAMLDKAIR